MVMDLNMFGPGMKNRIAREIYTAHVVTIKDNYIIHHNIKRM